MLSKTWAKRAAILIVAGMTAGCAGGPGSGYQGSGYQGSGDDCLINGFGEIVGGPQNVSAMPGNTILASVSNKDIGGVQSYLSLFFTKESGNLNIRLEREGSSFVPRLLMATPEQYAERERLKETMRRENRVLEAEKPNIEKRARAAIRRCGF